MAVCGPPPDTSNRVSLEDAIVGERWGDPNIGQLCKISINVLTKTQQFDRFPNRFGRSRDEPNRRDQEPKIQRIRLSYWLPLSDHLALWCIPRRLS